MYISESHLKICGLTSASSGTKENFEIVLSYRDMYQKRNLFPWQHVIICVFCLISWLLCTLSKLSLIHWEAGIKPHLLLYYTPMYILFSHGTFYFCMYIYFVTMDTRIWRQNGNHGNQNHESYCKHHCTPAYQFISWLSNGVSRYGPFQIWHSEKSEK